MVKAVTSYQWLIVSYDFTVSVVNLTMGLECLNKITKIGYVVFFTKQAIDVTLMLSSLSFFIIAFAAMAYINRIYNDQLYEYCKDWYYERPMNHKFEFIRY